MHFDASTSRLRASYREEVLPRDDEADVEAKAYEEKWRSGRENSIAPLRLVVRPADLHLVI
jgi:hypothetical protein